MRGWFCGLLVAIIMAGLFPYSIARASSTSQAPVETINMDALVDSASVILEWRNVPKVPTEFDAYLDGLKGEQVKLSKDALHRYLREGYAYSLEQEYSYGQAELAYRLGLYYATENLYSLAEEAYKESLALFKTLDLPIKVANVEASLGPILGRKGQFDEATAILLDALKLYEDLQDQRGISSTHLKLGTVYTYLDDYDQGLKHYEKALGIALEHDKENVITLYGNIGFIYLDIGEFEKSEEYFMKAIEYPVVPKTVRPRALAYLNLGQLYQTQGKQVLANRYFDQAEKLAKEENLAEELIALALLRIDESTPAAKERSIQKLLDLKNHAKQYELTYIQTELLKKLIELGKSLHRYEQTIEWMEEKDVLENQLFNERKEKDIANLRTTYEIEKSNQQIQDLKLQVKSERRNRAFTLYFSMILAVVVVLLIYFYLKAKKANRLLREREEALENSIQMKNKLFSIIGHDLKNAIGSQPIVLELLRSAKNNPEETDKLIDGLEASVHNTLYVFDTMIHWGKMQFKGISVNPKEFEVRPLVDNSVRLLKLNAELKELQIVNVIPPDTSLYADQDHFRFIMRNLLSNAIKYSRKGEEIRVGVKEVLANQVVFFVEDHGIGMSAEEVETLFDPDRSSIMGTNNETGHGIALMLSKEFVAKNGGEIWVDSKKGIGTTFYFSMNSKWNKQ